MSDNETVDFTLDSFEQDVDTPIEETPVVEDVVKTKDLNFDLHEELVTELHHTNKLKELVQRGEITHSIGVNAIFHLFLELQSTDSL